MLATEIAPLSAWKESARQIGVTWKARDYTDDFPTVSSQVVQAHVERPAATLPELLRSARAIQTDAADAQERRAYYARLPRRGQTYQPDAHGGPETVAWTRIHSGGNHHLYHLDLIASTEVRPDDSAVVPRVRDGLGRSVVGTVMACPAGTPAAAAVRQLVLADRQYRRAWMSFAASAARCDAQSY